MPRDPEALIIARPTIRMDGTEYPLLSAKIQRMEMQERTGGLSVLELSFVDWISGPNGSAGFGAVGDQPLRLGAQISLYAGDATEPQEIFAGRITAIESELRQQGAPLFTILAEDALFIARRTTRRRTFEDSTAADIAEAVAQDHGLRTEIRPGLDTTVKVWTQMNETDLDFLRRVLDAADADMQVVGDVLQVGPRAEQARTELELSYPRDIVSARVTADLAKQVVEQVVTGFDVETGQPVSARSFDFNLGPGLGDDGSTVLDREFGSVEAHVGIDGPLSQGEAEMLVGTAFRTRARRFVQVDATTQGNPELRVGSWVTLLGLSPAFENIYSVTSATHRFDPVGGYRTDFLAESAYLGSAQ